MIEHLCSLEKIPLLLGLSGGPDSMALFHLLLERAHPFQAAYLDHGWRSGSAHEAAQLKAICQKWGVKFHTRRAQLEGPNLEDLSRNARFTFFREVCIAEELEGVLLAHHADDQAETVLKRVFEGASLPKLSGLSFKSHIGGLTLYRPLLKVRKQEILDWLEEKRIAYFQDVTNKDPRFLRSRMREVLLPTLSQQFGKQISTSLCRLGEAAAELREFLQLTLEPFRRQIMNNEEDRSLDFNQFPPQPRFIYKAVIRELFEQEQLTLSTPLLETILAHLQKNSARKTLQVGKKEVEIHRGVLTIKKLKLLRL